MARSIAKLSVVSQETSEDRRSPPERIGPYRIEGRLGIGGMGEVYRAYDERLERWVAIKKILPGDTEDPRARERLRREARAVASLNHPAIVQVHDILEMDKGDWIVMELVEGQTLRDLLREGVLELAQSLYLVREIAGGLAEAHAKGIVHRDLKTENVMVIPEGHAKILDFGLAKLLWHRQPEATLSGQGTILGTGRSMSPEQILGDPVDHRSDLFSLGVLVFETLTGRRPFAGTSLILTLAQVCTAKQLSAKELNPNIPDELSALIDGLLEKDPSDRPQNAQEVAALVERIASTLAPEQAESKIPALDETSPPRNLEQIPMNRLGAATPSSAVPAPSAEIEPGKTLVASGIDLQAVAELGASRSEPSSGLFIKSLLKIVLVNRAEIDEQTIERHDQLMRELLKQYDGVEIDFSDGFLLLFERPVDAVQFAVVYQRRLARLSEILAVELRARCGIHLGEVSLRESSLGDELPGPESLEVERLSRLIVERTTSLARGGQILLTREAHELAHPAIATGPLSDQDLHWVAHGRYLFEGVEEIVRLFELSSESIALIAPPADTEGARRILDEDGIRHPKRRGGWKLLVASAVLVALGIAAALLRFQMATPKVPERPSPAVRPSIAVLGFKDLSGNPDTDWLSTALAETFSTELAAGENLRLISGESVRRMQKELSVPDTDTLAADTLDKIRDHLGADYLILGSYISLEQGAGRRLRLQLRLQDTRGGGEPVAPTLLTGDEADLVDLVTRAGAEVRKKLGIAKISTAEAKSVRASVSSSPTAAQSYFEGLNHLRNFDAQAARKALEEAVAIDPQYAPAHGALSRAWLALGYDNKARNSAEMAYQLAGELPREANLWIEGCYYEAAAEWQKAIDSTEVLWGFFPDNVEYGIRLAEVQTNGGRGAEALETITELRALPGSEDDPLIDLAEAHARESLSDYQGALNAAVSAEEKGRARDAWILVAEAQRLQGRSYLFLGKAKEAEEVLEQARRLFNDAGDRGKLAEVLYLMAVQLQNKGKPSQVENLLQQALTIHTETHSRKRVSDVLNGLAYSKLKQGKLLEAEPLLEQALMYARGVGDRSREATYLDTKAWLFLRLGRLIEAEEVAAQGLAVAEEVEYRTGSGWHTYNLGQLRFAAGELTEAQSLHEKALEIGNDIEVRNMSVVAFRGLGEIFVARGYLTEAQGVFQAAEVVQGEGEPPETQLARARLLLELGRASEAETLAGMAAGEFERTEKVDHQAVAAAVVATARLAQEQLAAAREILTPAMARAKRSEAPEVRITVAVAEARLLAAEGNDDTLRRLDTALAEATKLGFVALEFEARLARGEIEIDRGEVATGRARLEALAGEAKEKGFGLIARKAQAASRSPG
ncbi:MAG: protein kinase [bacterium]|nr:protein kinase [bacterium]